MFYNLLAIIEIKTIETPLFSYFDDKHDLGIDLPQVADDYHNRMGLLRTSIYFVDSEGEEMRRHHHTLNAADAKFIAESISLTKVHRL